MQMYDVLRCCCRCHCQGGWRCHHIDDLHPSEDRLPSLAALREHSVSSLFEAAVNAGSGSIGRDVDDADDVMEDVSEPMSVDDLELTAQYDEDMDTVEPLDMMKPAVNVAHAVTNARRKEARQAVQFGRHLMERHPSSSEQLDVDTIICNCVHLAMTMLKDKDNCRGRKTSRLQLLLSLLSAEQTGT